VWKLVGPLILIHELILFFSGVSLPLVHPVAFAVHFFSVSYRSTDRKFTTWCKGLHTKHQSLTLSHIIRLGLWESGTVRCQVIDRKSNKVNRWIREAVRLGENKTSPWTQLLHICDYSLSAVATPGGRSFRRRRQWLPKHQQCTRCFIKKGPPFLSFIVHSRGDQFARNLYQL